MDNADFLATMWDFLAKIIPIIAAFLVAVVAYKQKQSTDLSKKTLEKAETTEKLVEHNTVVTEQIKKDIETKIVNPTLKPPPSRAGDA